MAIKETLIKREKNIITLDFFPINDVSALLENAKFRFFSGWNKSISKAYQKHGYCINIVQKIGK